MYTLSTLCVPHVAVNNHIKPNHLPITKSRKYPGTDYDNQLPLKKDWQEAQPKSGQRTTNINKNTIQTFKHNNSLHLTSLQIHHHGSEHLDSINSNQVDFWCGHHQFMADSTYAGCHILLPLRSR